MERINKLDKNMEQFAALWRLWDSLKERERNLVYQYTERMSMGQKEYGAFDDAEDEVRDLVAESIEECLDLSIYLGRKLQIVARNKNR